MKYCPDCGLENIDEAKFCRNCGCDLSNVSQKPQKVKQNKPAATKDNSIVSKVFYKTDKYTGELRFAKSKSISITIFVLMFLLAIVSPPQGISFVALLITAVIFGLMFAIPVYVIGFIVGLIVDKIQN